MSKTSPVTLQWYDMLPSGLYTICLLYCRLEENYEISDGVCLPRSVLYNHYQDFCKRNAMEPVGAASFGKVVFIYNAHCIHTFNHILYIKLCGQRPQLIIH